MKISILILIKWEVIEKQIFSLNSLHCLNEIASIFSEIQDRLEQFFLMELFRHYLLNHYFGMLESMILKRLRWIQLLLIDSLVIYLAWPSCLRMVFVLALVEVLSYKCLSKFLSLEEKRQTGCILQLLISLPASGPMPYSRYSIPYLPYLLYLVASKLKILSQILVFLWYMQLFSIL